MYQWCCMVVEPQRRVLQATENARELNGDTEHAAKRPALIDGNCWSLTYIRGTLERLSVDGPHRESRSLAAWVVPGMVPPRLIT
jgi:hypothetical protein